MLYSDEDPWSFSELMGHLHAQFNSILKTFPNYGISAGGVFLLILIIMLKISKQIILLLGCGNCCLSACILSISCLKLSPCNEYCKMTKTDQIRTNRRKHKIKSWTHIFIKPVRMDSLKGFHKANDWTPATTESAFKSWPAAQVPLLLQLLRRPRKENCKFNVFLSCRVSSALAWETSWMLSLKFQVERGFWIYLIVKYLPSMHWLWVWSPVLQAKYL